MKPEEIKVGSFVNLKLLVPEKYPAMRNDDGIKGIVLETPTGKSFVVWEDDFEALSPANGIKNAEPAPKYDPCRPFKAGDIVTPCSVKGRWFVTDWKGHREIRFTVTKAENEEGTMWVQEDDSSTPIWVLAAFFQLISPVEELEPYMVKELKDSFIVYHDCTKIVLNDTSLLAKFMKASHPHAKEAAEAECARLNAEYRKDQE